MALSSSSCTELNWRNYLDPAHYNVPLHALRYNSTHRLALHLDSQDVVMFNNCMPNFGGLAEFVGFDGLEISSMERAQSPTKQLLNEWKNRPDLEPTIGRLVKFLALLGRVDALTDCQGHIRDDIKAYLEKPQQLMKSAPIQDETVSQGPGYEEIPPFITRPDVDRGCAVYFDAFICYNPYGESSKDIEFVRELITKFEGEPYRFNLFVPHRDDLAGLNAHTINAKIISERCRHMIVVLSPNFLASPACEFQSTFAHALSPGARSKRIVPIKIEECPMPNILRIMACCDFTKRDLWDWSWDRLAKSIMVQLSTEDFQVMPQSDLDSGFSGSSNSPNSSRSGSPVPSPRHPVTQPIIHRITEGRQPRRAEAASSNHTFPVSVNKLKNSSISRIFSRSKN